MTTAPSDCRDQHEEEREAPLRFNPHAPNLICARVENGVVIVPASWRDEDDDDDDDDADEVIAERPAAGKR